MNTLIAIAAAAILGAAAPAASSDEARERALWEMAATHRMEDFAAQLDPAFVAVYADGTNDKAAEVAAIAEQKLDSFSISDFRSYPVGADVVLVTYTVDARGTYRGEDISGRYHVASLWRRSAADWRLAYHSEVKAP